MSFAVIFLNKIMTARICCRSSEITHGTLTHTFCRIGQNPHQPIGIDLSTLLLVCVSFAFATFEKLKIVSPSSLFGIFGFSTLEGTSLASKAIITIIVNISSN